MSHILVVDDDRATRHLITEVLRGEGYAVAAAEDGEKALETLERDSFDLIVLDIWMPGMTGLELLARLRERPASPRVVVMTSDDTPETLLRAVREQAYQYVSKPVASETLLRVVRSALEAPAEPQRIEVISAKPDWVELLVPCLIETADRIQGFLALLDADLSPDVRESVGQAFRELLMNAVEWGGQLDPHRKVRIAYLRTRRMLLYRIADPGPGFRPEQLDHAAISNPAGAPFQHASIREEKGIRPGGFGILMARAMVDELLYNEKHNEVVLIKYLDA